MKNRIIAFAAAVLAVTALLADGWQTRALNPEDYICLPVLMYHSVKPSGSGKDSITPWEFENDLKFLRDNGYETVTMNELLSFVDGEGALPQKPVILSFDDGYFNNYKYVFPLLKKYDVKIVMSVIAHATDKFTRKPCDNVNYAHITWGQLNEMLDSGHAEVQNHSYNLHSYGKPRVGCGQMKGETLEKYTETLCEDIAKSQTLIFEMTGWKPTTFAYPYGKYNDSTVAILKSLGFRASFSCEYGINLLGKNGDGELFNLKRICRAHGNSAEKAIRGAMETLKYRQTANFRFLDV